MDDIDFAVKSLEDWESKQKGEGRLNQDRDKVLVGKVDRFFSKISVAAVTLVGELKVGDVIEIGDEEEAIRQKVSSMQIDRKDITEAGEGDDVGIKVNHVVRAGSNVYKMLQS